MISDLHIHSKYSYDADPSTIEEICTSAIDKGIARIGISDHMEFFRNKDFDTFDMEYEQNDIKLCREKYSDKIEILSAVEIGQPYANVYEADLFLSKYQFDYVIGSLHAMPNDIDIYFLEYNKMDCDQFLNDYFNELLALVNYGKFHILAHIDYPLRVMKQPHTHPSFAGYMDRVEPVLKKIIDKGIALEINAKGLYGWQQSVGPEHFVLDLYKQLGGEMITFGSDSHSAETVGRGIEECIQHAKNAGFEHYTYFKNGQPYSVKI